MVEANELIQPAMSFLGGAFGAGAIWSWRARGERRILKRQIRSILRQTDTALLNAYTAISSGDQKSAQANRNTLEILGGALEARLSRYALVYVLSNRSADHISDLIPLTKLLSALGQFANRYTLLRDGKHQGRNKFAALMALALEEAQEFKSTPDALNHIRTQFKLPPLSDEVRKAHREAVATVDKSRADIESSQTKGHATFLSDG